MVVKGRLNGFQIPVAEFMPDELIEVAGGIIESITVECFGDHDRNPPEPG